ncbi:UNVERIFIED_ORG: hypothetical protein Xoosp15_167 [Xanthomonas phage Xoo-sp15]
MQVNIPAHDVQGNGVELVRVVTGSAFDLLINGHVLAVRFRTEEIEKIHGCPNCVEGKPASDKFCSKCGCRLKSDVPKPVINNDRWIQLRWHGGALFESITNPLHGLYRWKQCKMHMNYFMQLSCLYYVKQK